MAKSYDAATKHLLEIDPPAWLAAVGLPATGPVRVIDSELSTVTAEADTVYRVGEPVDYLAHLEIQSGRDKAGPFKGRGLGVARPEGAIGTRPEQRVSRIEPRA